MKQLILILTIAMLSQQTFAHESSFICVKKSEKLNLCLQYRQHTHYYQRQRMVSISNQKYIYIQPKNVITESIYTHKHDKVNKVDKIDRVDRVLDTTIKLIILNELLK